MKAIFTKFIPSTNTKPSRIKAYDSGGNQIILSKDLAQFDTEGTRRKLNSDEILHEYVAIRLRLQMQWTGKLIGPAPTKEGYVFILKY